MGVRQDSGRFVAALVPLVLVLGNAGPALAAKPATTPKPVLTAKPQTYSNSKTASFAWTLATGTTYTCRLDAGTTVSCTSPKAYTGLADALHTFTVTAKKGTAKPGSTSYSWTVDTVAPAKPTVGPVASPTIQTSASVSFSDADTSVAGYTCTLDAGATSACTTPKALTGLGNGSHTLTVTALDRAGNAASAARSWVVDIVGPTKPVVTSSPATPTTQTDAAVAFSGTEAGETFTCALDTSTATPCASPWSDSGLTGGDHSLTVTPVDSLGNAGTPAVVTWTIDLTPPPAPVLVSGPATHTRLPAGQSTMQQAISFGDPEGFVTFQCSLDGAALTACTSPWTGDVAAGPHTFAVQAADALGNAGSQTQLVAWTVDANAFAPTFTQVPGYQTHVTQPTFGFAASSPADTDHFVCSLDGAAFTTCASPYTVGTPLTDGSHTFAVEAVDSSSTASDPTMYAWVQDTTAPTSAPKGGAGVPANSGQVTSTPTFTFSSSDPGVAGFVCSLDGGAYAPCSIGYSPIVGDGTHTLTVATVDQAGNVSTATLTYTWTLDTHRPTATLSFPTTSLLPALTVVFSENVQGVTGVTVRLRTGSSYPVTRLTCRSVTNVVVPCSGSVRRAVLTPVSRLVPGQKYQLVDTTAVHDVAGNPAMPLPTTVFRAMRLAQESELAVGETWSPRRSTAAYGGSFLQAHLAGARASYGFTGTSVTWYTATGPTMGTVRVYVDGVYRATVNDYAASTHWHVARTRTGLTNSSHTLVLVATGLKGSTLGRGTYVVLDAVKVGTAAVVTTPVVATRWASAALSTASAGRYALGDQAGEAVSLTFRGSSITWRTLLGRGMGTARVYVDGVLKGTYSNFASAARFTTWTWRTTDAVHTVRIVLTGTHVRGATGTAVVLDSLTVG